MEHKPSLRLLIVLAGLSITSIVLAYIGWWQDGKPLTDALYLAFTSVAPGPAYEEIAEQGFGNLWLEAARFLGLLVQPLVVVILFVGLFRKSLIRFGAAFKCDHLVVIGESNFADNLSNMPDASVVHLRGQVDDVHKCGGLVRLPLTGDGLSGLQWTGAQKACAIVIAPGDDSKAIDLALSARQEYKDTQIYVQAHDAWLAERIHSLPGGEQLCAFSEPGLAARFVVRNYPVYLIAQDARQERIHVLLMGDDDWLEALICEMILSARTLTFGKPMFTVLCANPGAFKAELSHRYPEIDAEADICLLRADALDDRAAIPAEMSGAFFATPLTAAYVLYRDGWKGLSASYGLAAELPEMGIAAPIFSANPSQNINRPELGTALATNQLVFFGRAEDLIAASGFLASKSGSLEQRFHEAYRQVSPHDAPANCKWGDLPEEYRASNRRVVGHIFAKLFDAGFDLRSWMQSHDHWLELPVLSSGEVLYRDAAERERLAELEHLRWMADRRISGWRYGSQRDNRRKYHPDIISFAQLPEDTKKFDRVSIDCLGDILKGIGSLVRIPSAD